MRRGAARRQIVSMRQIGLYSLNKGTGLKRTPAGSRMPEEPWSYWIECGAGSMDWPTEAAKFSRSLPAGRNIFLRCCLTRYIRRSASARRPSASVPFSGQKTEPMLMLSSRSAQTANADFDDDLFERQQFFGEMCDLEARQHQHELIAAHACDIVILATAFAQTLGHEFEHFVALQMAEPSFTCLKPSRSQTKTARLAAGSLAARQVPHRDAGTATAHWAAKSARRW